MLEAGTVQEKRVAIVQSCYIPWKGYFDLIAQVDEFILFDDAQFTRRDWRNRNQIKTKQGLRWLTIPVETKGKFEARIDEVRVGDPAWPKKHWETLRHAYGRAPHFAEGHWIEEIYTSLETDQLSVINYRFIRDVCQFLGIKTKLRWSTDYGHSEKTKTARLVELLTAAGATHYLSGPSARAYLELGLLEGNGFEVSFASYDGYPEYEQLNPPFRHQVSILDLIFCVGEKAREYLRFAV